MNETMASGNHPLYLKMNLKSMEDAKHLVQLMYPQWEQTSLVIEPISGGRTSFMFRCFRKDSEHEAITIRARNTMSAFTVHNPKVEAEVVKFMAALGHFPKLLLVFDNGYCYHYIKGECLFNLQHFYELKKPLLRMTEQQLCLTAKRLAGIHSIQFPGLNYSTTKYFENLHRILSNYYPKHMEGLPTFDEMKNEVDFLTKEAANLNAPLVLCHGDAHVGNIIWNKAQKFILFMDWEMTHIGYQAYDIATFLFLLDYEDAQYGFPKDIPCDYEQKFLCYYMEQVTENNKTQKMCRNLGQLQEQIYFFKMVLKVYFPLLIGSMQAQLSIKSTHQKFDIPRFLSGMFREYQQCKKLYEHKCSI